jgi:hypothetical protein
MSPPFFFFFFFLLFTLVISQTGFHIFTQVSLAHNSIYAFGIAALTGMHHHTQLFCWHRCLTNFLLGLADLKPQSPHLCLPSSWDYRSETLRMIFLISTIELNWLKIPVLKQLVEKDESYQSRGLGLHWSYKFVPFGWTQNLWRSCLSSDTQKHGEVHVPSCERDWALWLAPWPPCCGDAR